jgi:hypothetical protein
MQVSSAAVERVFSLLPLGFEKGDAHLADYVESSLMLAYNSNKQEFIENIWGNKRIFLINSLGIFSLFLGIYSLALIC